jgi:hypothetical protein
MERKRIAEATKGIGKPKVGGEFDLIDHNGNKFTQESMKGKYALVRFSARSEQSAVAYRQGPFWPLIAIHRACYTDVHYLSANG